MLVIPAPGLSIRDPDLLDLLPDTGRNVPETPYWMCRLRDKDVILAGDDAAASVTQPEGSNEE